METIKQKRREVLDIVAKHFNSKNRSVQMCGSECLYLSDDGSKCAVGMFIKDEYINDDRWLDTHNGEDAYYLLENTDEILVEEYRGLGAEFWTSVQRLHDEAVHWDKKGLTTEGKAMVAEIKEEFAL